MLIDSVMTILAPLTFVIVTDSGWSENLVQEQLVEATAVYAECGVELAPVNIVTVPAPQIPLKRDIRFKNEGLLIEDFVASLSINFEGITVYFVGQFANPKSTTAFARAPYPGYSPTSPILDNTVWLPIAITSDEDRQRSRNYSVFAHELAHLFLLQGGHNGFGQPIGIGNGRYPGEPDILTIAPGRTNRIAHLCEDIRKSPLLLN